MNCKSVQSLLSAYIDSELSGREMQIVRHHLACCNECCAEETEIRSLKQFLIGVPIVEPPADFEERLVANVMRETRKQERLAPVLSMLSGVAVAAMALTLMVLNFASGGQAQQSARKSDTIALEVRRDQANTAGIDPLGGTPVVVPASYAQR